MRKRSISLMSQLWRQRLLSSSLFVLLFLLSTSLLSQNLLIIDHPTKKHRLRFREKNEISILSKDGVYTSGVISSINDSTLLIGKNEIELGDIAYVIVERRILQLFSNAFKAAGVAYLGLDVFNAITNGDRPIISTYTIAGPAIVFAGGLFMGLLSSKKYGPLKGHRLRILNT